MSTSTTERRDFLVDNLDLAQATGVEDARWEPFQLAHLNDDRPFRIEVKSRQIAWSWLAAAEGVANAVLDGQTTIFVSINQDEATEKIRYARTILEALQVSKLPRIIRDNLLGIELANGGRLLSLPATPPRGKARCNVVLDEYAHTARDREIYTAALPIISKGGRLRIGSSPLGASGMFWEVYAEKLRLYPGYSRRGTPWWEVQAFCKDVRTAMRWAPRLLTAERVERFGNDRIKAIWSNMPEEDFRQEYECEFVDESTAWISWEEIRGAQRDDLTCLLASCRAGDTSAALDAITAAARLIREGQIESVLAAGMDIGRTRNASELYLVGMSSSGQLPLRLGITLEAMPFDEQLDVLVHALQQLPVVAVLIDRNGIGRNIAENAEKQFPGKAQGIDFTVQNKALWAGDTKMLFQQHRALVPVDRDLAYQIHSIKRLVTPAKNLVFDTARNEKHHADKFWALALAYAASKTELPGPVKGQEKLYGKAVPVQGRMAGAKWR